VFRRSQDEGRRRFPSEQSDPPQTHPIISGRNTADAAPGFPALRSLHTDEDVLALGAPAAPPSQNLSTVHPGESRDPEIEERGALGNARA